MATQPLSRGTIHLYLNQSPSARDSHDLDLPVDEESENDLPPPPPPKPAHYHPASLSSSDPVSVSRTAASKTPVALDDFPQPPPRSPTSANSSCFSAPSLSISDPGARISADSLDHHLCSSDDVPSDSCATDALEELSLRESGSLSSSARPSEDSSHKASSMRSYSSSTSAPTNATATAPMPSSSGWSLSRSSNVHTASHSLQKIQGSSTLHRVGSTSRDVAERLKLKERINAAGRRIGAVASSYSHSSSNSRPSTANSELSTSSIAPPCNSPNSFSHPRPRSRGYIPPTSPKFPSSSHYSIYGVRVPKYTTNIVFGRPLLDTVVDTNTGQPDPSFINSPNPRREEARPWLPAVVYRCLEFIDYLADKEPGIYRIPGSSRAIADLRLLFDSGCDLDFLSLDYHDIDPHAVASLFKAWLRELPDPLLSPTVEKDIDRILIYYTGSPAASAELIQVRNDGTGPRAHGPLPITALKEMSELLKRLPKQNFYLLREISYHLAYLADRSHINKMTLSNLRLILSPTLRLSPVCLQIFVEERDVLFPVSFPPTVVPASPITNVPLRSSSHSQASQASFVTALSNSRPPTANTQSSVQSGVGLPSNPRAGRPNTDGSIAAAAAAASTPDEDPHLASETLGGTPNSTSPRSPSMRHNSASSSGRHDSASSSMRHDSTSSSMHRHDSASLSVRHNSDVPEISSPPAQHSHDRRAPSPDTRTATASPQYLTTPNADEDRSFDINQNQTLKLSAPPSPTPIADRFSTSSNGSNPPPSPTPSTHTPPTPSQPVKPYIPNRHHDFKPMFAGRSELQYSLKNQIQSKRHIKTTTTNPKASTASVKIDPNTTPTNGSVAEIATPTSSTSDDPQSSTSRSQATVSSSSSTSSTSITSVQSSTSSVETASKPLQCSSSESLEVQQEHPKQTHQQTPSTSSSGLASSDIEKDAKTPSSEGMPAATDEASFSNDEKPEDYDDDSEERVKVEESVEEDSHEYEEENAKDKAKTKNTIPEKAPIVTLVDIGSDFGADFGSEFSILSFDKT